MNFSIDSGLKLFDAFQRFIETQRKNEQERTDKINRVMDKLCSFNPQSTLADADCEFIIEAIEEFQNFVRKDYFSELSNPQMKRLVLSYWDLYDDTRQYLKNVRTGKTEKKREDLVRCYEDLYNSLDKLLNVELKVWKRLCSYWKARRSKPVVNYTESSWFLSLSAKQTATS